jgi:chromosome segregation ATPase
VTTSHYQRSSYLLDEFATSLQAQRAQAERRLRVLSQKADELGKETDKLGAQIKALERQLVRIDRAARNL